MTTLDPANKSSFITLTGGNLVATSNLSNVGALARARGTTSKSDDRYFEVLVGARFDAASQGIGVCIGSFAMTGFNFATGSTGFRSGVKHENSGTGVSDAAYTVASGNTVGVLVSPSRNKMWVSINGAWIGDPVAGTGGLALDTTTEDFYALALLTPRNTGTQNVLTFNFGATAFTYSVPAGALGWDATGATPVGRADETDAAYALQAKQLLPTGMATEVETAFALAAKQIAAVGRSDETDAAFALGQPSGVGRANETDTAFALSAKQLRPPGIAVEADTATALGRAIGITRATEVDTALALLPISSRAAGRADETDTAIARPAVQITPCGRANESDIALPLGSGQSSPVGLAIEIDTALGLVPVALRQVTAANENDVAFSLGARQIGSVGIATEADAAFALFPANYVLPPVPPGRRVVTHSDNRRATTTRGRRAA